MTMGRDAIDMHSLLVCLCRLFPLFPFLTVLPFLQQVYRKSNGEREREREREREKEKEKEGDGER